MLHDQVIAILNSLSECVFIIDADRRVLFANAPAARMFGSDLQGRDLVRAIRHPECLRIVGEVLSGAGRASSELTLQAPVKATFEVHATRLDPADDMTMRAAVTLYDISHIRQAERMRSDFVANVSHELRSPLTTIAGFIETLKGAARDDPSARARFLDLMENETGRMARLISDLLTLSAVEVNERVRPTATADIVAIARRAVANLSERAKRERKTIRLEAPPEVPPIPGDEDELTQVLHNLIENAVKYGGPDTAIAIRIGMRAQAPGIRGPALAIEVADRGEGIAAEHLPRLTERFYRADPSRSRDKGGTGLGLAIVKHILKRHRGRLLIESRPGYGSTFTALLPAAAGEPVIKLLHN